jgi:hypothetical protein
LLFGLQALGAFAMVFSDLFWEFVFHECTFFYGSSALAVLQHCQGIFVFLPLL